MGGVGWVGVGAALHGVIRVGCMQAGTCSGCQPKRFAKLNCCAAPQVRCCPRLPWMPWSPRATTPWWTSGQGRRRRLTACQTWHTAVRELPHLVLYCEFSHLPLASFGSRPAVPPPSLNLITAPHSPSHRRPPSTSLPPHSLTLPTPPSPCPPSLLPCCRQACGAGVCVCQRRPAVRPPAQRHRRRGGGAFARGEGRKEGGRQMLADWLAAAGSDCRLDQAQCHVPAPPAKFGCCCCWARSNRLL